MSGEEQSAAPAARVSAATIPIVIDVVCITIYAERGTP